MWQWGFSVYNCKGKGRWDDYKLDFRYVRLQQVQREFTQTHSKEEQKASSYPFLIPQRYIHSPFPSIV
jgi:hypothetical protein